MTAGITTCFVFCSVWLAGCYLVFKGKHFRINQNFQNVVMENSEIFPWHYNIATDIYGYF